MTAERNLWLLVLTVPSKKLLRERTFYAVGLKEKNVESKMKIAKSKLKLLEEMKEEYVKHNGEEKYAKKRATLMNALIDAGDEDDVSTSVSTKMSTGVSTKSMSELDNSVQLDNSV